MSVLNFLFASLIPLFIAAREDAKTREVSNAWVILLGLIGVGFNLFFSSVLNVALALLIIVLFKLRPKEFPGGDAGVLFGLSLIWGVLMIPMLGLALVYGLVWNVVKRRSWNTPLPLVTFLFFGACSVMSALLLGVF